MRAPSKLRRIFDLWPWALILIEVILTVGRSATLLWLLAHWIWGAGR
jgi:hypothetical protein